MMPLPSASKESKSWRTTAMGASRPVDMHNVIIYIYVDTYIYI